MSNRVPRPWFGSVFLATTFGKKDGKSSFNFVIIKINNHQVHDVFPDNLKINWLFFA